MRPRRDSEKMREAEGSGPERQDNHIENLAENCRRWPTKTASSARSEDRDCTSRSNPYEL